MSDKSMERIVQNALKAVAKREGISVESVRGEMETAIAAARENDDPKIQNLWGSISSKDKEELTPEDVIAHFARLDRDSGK